MKFYDREEELAELEKLLGQTAKSSHMAVLTGRRRVGKTLLSLEFVKNKKYLYFFVSKKSETLLCEEYAGEIRRLFPDAAIADGIRSFKDLFHLLLVLARDESFTVIIDEFQEFTHINPAVYSEIQKLWDLNKTQSRLNLICVGSVYSLMHKIFEGAKEPLFNRADRILTLKPFPLKVLAQVLCDYKAENTRLLFDYYLFTGGSPKYIDLLVENKAFSVKEILDLMIAADSPFINEGKNLLIEEFGKEYGTYFSILEMIASGKTGRSEIESILETNVGGYLDRLEKDYAVIERRKPVNAKQNSKTQKYVITDNFLNFWFRFVYRNRSAIETGNFKYIKDEILWNYSTYSGKILERFYRALFAETGRYNRIGSYWDRSHQNEVDLVAINDMKKEMVVAEVKLNPKKINIEDLKRRASRLLPDFVKYKVEWLALSLENIGDFLR
ncbi:MAG: ATP-binding protein [Candidatus Omnitrophota bacterium]